MRWRRARAGRSDDGRRVALDRSPVAGHGRRDRDAAHLGEPLRLPRARAQALGPPRLSRCRPCRACDGSPRPWPSDTGRARWSPRRTRRSASCSRPRPRPSRRRAPSGPEAAAGVEGLLELVAHFEAERLRQALVADWARLGPVEFLESRVAPLVRAVGEAWARGELEIRHEHFLSERVGDLLGVAAAAASRSARAARWSSTRRCPASCTGSACRCRRWCWRRPAAAASTSAPTCPVPQLQPLVRDLAARAVAISISRATRGQASSRARCAGCARRSPAACSSSWAARARPAAKPGIEVVTSLRELDAWGRGSRFGLPAARPDFHFLTQNLFKTWNGLGSGARNPLLTGEPPDPSRERRGGPRPRREDG